MRITPKQRTIALTLGLFLIIWGVVFGIMLPTFNAIRTITSEIFASQTQVEESAVRARQVRKTISELPNAKMAVEPLRLMTVPPDSEVALIEKLERLAEEQDIDLTLQVSIKRTKDRKDFNKLPATGINNYYEFSLTTRGSYDDQLSFLRILETLPEYVIIDSLSLKRADLDDITLRFSAIILING